MISRSAVFLPMRGTFTRLAVSSYSTQRRKPSTLIPERIASAIRAPTPLTFSRLRNSARSSSVANPYSCWASSRTSRWVSSRTSAPVCGSWKNVDIGVSTS